MQYQSIAYLVCKTVMESSKVTLLQPVLCLVPRNVEISTNSKSFVEL